jgi:hypothetical protein
MIRNPYLEVNRLQDVLAALQFFATYPDYDLTSEDFRSKLGAGPKSTSDWSSIFTDHPEFFRLSERHGDYSLVLRRARPKNDDGLRPVLSSDELSTLIKTAIDLQKHALEIQRERRAWVPLAISGVAAGTALLGALLGAWIKSKS